MTRGEPRWRQDRFLDELESCIDREGLTGDIRLIVLPWIMSRLDDPYRGARREPGMEHPAHGNLWYSAVPESTFGAGRVLACSYWISESNRLVRCNSFAVLSLPS